QVSSTANVSWYDVGGDGSLKSISKTAGPYLTRTGSAREPNFREISP
ncbi:MAG: hypothetical protein HYV13_03570, partial [Candidatus Doudnabacteria bacterium]|nr:hypothetical protein [Candidatus Doudnabacteria bacterium]